jgi:dolichol-phosphate mannosyltransferase
LPKRRLALSRCGNYYASTVLALGVKDTTAGYRAYTADILRDIDVATTQTTGYGFQVECTYRVIGAGGKIVEVPICFTDRVRGNSKMSMRIITEAMSLVTWWGVRDRVFNRRLRKKRA